VEPLSEGESFETPPAEEGEVAVLEVLDGRVVIEFYPESAPDHVANFKKLARQGFYNGTAFHRVIPGYLIQGGDPNTKDDDRTNDGEGSVGYRLPAEINHHRHVPGTVSMAFPAIPDPKGDRASDGSQFFICLSPAPLLDGRHTVFGQVSQGFDLLRRIGEMDRDERNNPLDRVEIKKVSILPKRAVP
jgi:peptidyl-prolyl cis-trans isomerase B (cyclophilin B)